MVVGLYPPLEAGRATPLVGGVVPISIKKGGITAQVEVWESNPHKHTL